MNASVCLPVCQGRVFHESTTWSRRITAFARSFINFFPLIEAEGDEARADRRRSRFLSSAS